MSSRNSVATDIERRADVQGKERRGDRPELQAFPLPARKLRLLIFTTLFPSSARPLAGHFVWERMRHLTPYADMTVVSPVPYSPPVRLNDRWSEFARVAKHETHAGFTIHHPRYIVVPKFGMVTHGASMLAGSLPQMWRELRRADFDLIDAHYVYPDGLAAVLLGQLLRKPVVVSARGSDINEFPGYRSIRPMIRYVLRRTTKVISVAQALKDAMVELGCPDDKITVIGNGVDAVKFSPMDSADARSKLGLPLDRPIVLSVGHLIERKGFHILIDAIARLKARRPNVLLIIVGEGIYRPKLEARIRELGLAGNVELVGARGHNELAPWYSAANVFCLASSREGWANVILEAMACGLPVIATRIWGTPEIVTGKELGTLVQRDAAAFETAIDNALAASWDSNRIVDYARQHTWERVAQRQLEVYARALETPVRFQEQHHS